MYKGGTMKTEKQRMGAWGEQRAPRFLIEKGYTIIERNFQTRRGEIDIIAWHHKYHHGKTLCFIEVKTRSYGKGSAERATGYAKQKSMQAAARQYCLEKAVPIEGTPIQFEQVSVYKGQEPVLYTIPI